MPTDTFFLYLGFSLFLQFTSFVSSLLFTPYELEIESKLNESNFPSAPARASMVVHGPACLLIYFVSNSSLRFDLNAMASFELAAGFDLAPFRENAQKKSCILPQDHGVLAFCFICMFKINFLRLNFYQKFYLLLT